MNGDVMGSGSPGEDLGGNPPGREELPSDAVRELLRQWSPGTPLPGGSYRRLGPVGKVGSPRPPRERLLGL